MTEPLPKPTTKSKQREVLRVCINALRQDVHVLKRHGGVLKHLDELLEQTWNRRSPPAPTASARMTAELAEKIRVSHRNNPDQTYQHLAMVFGVNIGRVSEAIRGKRT